VVPPMVSGVQVPSPTYVGPVFRNSSGSNKPIKRIVIHSTVSPCVPGGAREIAKYFRSSQAGGSAHYCVDPDEAVQCEYDSVICWHAPPNEGSLGIEMCDLPGPVPGDKPWTAAYVAARQRWRWNKPEQLEMLARTARLAAGLCAYYDVPPWFVGARGLRRGHQGVTTHNSVSTAWHESTHWDPGFWPRRQFMRMVRQHYTEITGIVPARGKTTGKRVSAGRASEPRRDVMTGPL